MIAVNLCTRGDIAGARYPRVLLCATQTNDEQREKNTEARKGRPTISLYYTFRDGDGRTDVSWSTTGIKQTNRKVYIKEQKIAGPRQLSVVVVDTFNGFAA